MFSRMNSSFLKNWIESLSTTSRCKEKYPICVREIFKHAILQYNDEENGVVRIKYPWTKVTIPKSDTLEKRDIPIGLLRKFFQIIPDDSRFKHALGNLDRMLQKYPSVCVVSITLICSLRKRVSITMAFSTITEEKQVNLVPITHTLR